MIRATAEYLRPILLIQAQRVDDCEPLRERLVQEFNIPKDEVKISVGRIEELKGIADIASPKCPVRFILTVEKLREGWDCPFAYVLCSLKETGKAGLVEIGEKGEVQTSVLQETPDTDFVAVLHQQMLLIGGTGDWTEAALVAWLDAHLFVAAEDRQENHRGRVRGISAQGDSRAHGEVCPW